MQSTNKSVASMAMALASRSWVTVERIFFRYIPRSKIFRSLHEGRILGTEDDATCDQTRLPTNEISAAAGYETQSFFMLRSTATEDRG